MFGTKIGDTAYFDPELRSIVHYRGKRYLMVTFFGSPDGVPAGGGSSPLHGSTSTPPAPAASTAPRAPGATPRTATCRATRSPRARSTRPSPATSASPADGEAVVYMAIVAGQSREDLLELHKWLVKMGPQGVIDRTTAYWRLWVGGTNINFGNLPAEGRRAVQAVAAGRCARRSTTAARSSRPTTRDIMQFSRDTYSYMWPRDGALVANSLDLAGFPDVARSFYTVLPEGDHRGGLLLSTSTTPTARPAISWHPWVLKGQQSMPIQEDETALVVWALWRHYYRYRDIEFIRPLWVDVVQKAADFMVRYRDPRTGLPLPSYDLWEERWGVHAFTVATVYGGLKAAHNFAVGFGDRERAEVYAKAAEEVKAGAAKYLFSEKLNRFVRRLVPRHAQAPRRRWTARYAASNDAADVRRRTAPTVDELFEVDETIDASLYAIFKFHLFEADDPRVAVHHAGGRAEAVGQDRASAASRGTRTTTTTASATTSPPSRATRGSSARCGWPTTSSPRAKSPDELKMALPIFEWTAAPRAGERRARRAGQPVHQRAAERQPAHVEPRDGRQHRDQVPGEARGAADLRRLPPAVLPAAPRAGRWRCKSQAVFDRLDAEFDSDEARETAAPSASSSRPTPRLATPARCGRRSRSTRATASAATSASPTATKGVLRMVDGKAMVDLRHLNQCDLDGECVRICPTRVISLHTEPYDPPAQEPLAELTARKPPGWPARDVERALGGLVVLGPAGPGAAPPPCSRPAQKWQGRALAHSRNVTLTRFHRTLRRITIIAYLGASAPMLAAGHPVRPAREISALLCSARKAELT